MPVNILCIGDLVGRPGKGLLADHLKRLIAEREIDFVICNAENAAGGSGLTPQIFQKLLHYGVDVATLGDHVFRRVEIAAAMAGPNGVRLVRPANISPAAAGRGWTAVPSRSGHLVGVTCLLGQMYMGYANSPWAAIDAVLAEMPAEARIRIVDFHAEASSEKIAMGWHLNGRVSAVFGTHTHTPTADARVLDGGTAFISDVGMTGPYDSVLGRRKERVLSYLTTAMPTAFLVADGDPRLSAVLVAVEAETGKALSIERIEIAGRALPQEGAAPLDDD